jgi:hypothetical protein
MKLTKSQRHTGYIILLAEAEKAVQRNTKVLKFGLCSLIRRVLGINNFGYVTSKNAFSGVGFVIEHFFPELEAKKPYPSYSYLFWFARDKDGWKQRIELLKQCIIEN